jgi:fatty aldehyde-generating acyl-ACP reductase
VGDAGITVRDNVDIAVTTGNSYTVGYGNRRDIKSAALMDIDMERQRYLLWGQQVPLGESCPLIFVR